MNQEPGAYPILTYQDVEDGSGALTGLSAVAPLAMTLEELEQYAISLGYLIEHGRAARKLAGTLGFPMTPEAKRYPGVGIHIVIEGPEVAQILVVGARRYTEEDAAATLFEAGEVVEEPQDITEEEANQRRIDSRRDEATSCRTCDDDAARLARLEANEAEAAAAAESNPCDCGDPVCPGTISRSGSVTPSTLVVRAKPELSAEGKGMLRLVEDEPQDFTVDFTPDEDAQTDRGE